MQEMDKWYRILDVNQLKRLNEMPADRSQTHEWLDHHINWTKNIDIAIITHQFSDKKVVYHSQFQC
jgi:hypothetical protein